ncbi:MAG: hypothetical protein ACJ76N_10950 [Thermoanaerobaculia bacterium]
MSVRLEAIKFNHDPSSATSDAFNIRRNATQFVSVPEWQHGVSVLPEDSPAAYAMKETRGHTITIQAQFRALDPGLGTVEIRAIDPTLIPKPWPFGWLLWPLLWILRYLLRLFFGNVLGEVRRRKVTFPPGGLTGIETFRLKNVAIQIAGVGVRTTTWRWQYRRSGGAWTDFETTQHRIYVVVETPKSPWNQAPYNSGNTQLPWTEVLDYACRWGLLARTADAAAAGVTRGVYNLGPAVITYDCPGGGSTHYSWGSFDCTRFLERLKGGVGLGLYVNCTDCATILSTFANALGADLWQSRMEPPGAPWSFGLNPMLGIGSAVWQPCCGWSGFSYHEVAWKGACTATEEVFDACLQVDGDADPTAPPHVPLLPVSLRFGPVGALLYRDRLATPAGRPHCEPNPASRQRRIVV